MIDPRNTQISRLYAVEAFGIIGRKRSDVGRLFLKMYDDPDPAIRMTVVQKTKLLDVPKPEKLRVLSARLGDSDDNVRLFSAQSLFTVDPENKELIPTLTDLLGSKELSVTTGAIELLRKCGPRSTPASGSSRAVAEGREYLGKRSGRIGPF